MIRSRRHAAIAALALCTACTPVARTPEWSSVHELTPAFLQSAAVSDPGLAAGPDGRIALTWVSNAGADAWIAVSADSGGHFAPPVRLNERPGSVDSYSESRPVAAFGPEGRLVVAWTAAREGDDGGTGGADDIVARASADDGRTFGATAILNRDHADPDSRYHGFVALDVDAAGHAVVAWIDGRAARLAAGEDEPARSEVWCAASDDGGRNWRPDVRVAGDACSCCRVAVRANAGGTVAVAYRGARDDLRDPRLALSRDGGARFALDTLVSADRWKLPGCPSVGPALTLDPAGGGEYAWFTGAGPTPGVWIVPWRADGGAAGMKRALDDSLRDVTRPMLSPMGSATLAGVLARPRRAGPRKVLAVRVLDADGSATPWLFLGSAVRSAAIAGAGPGTAYVAWLEERAEGPRLRVARIARR